MGTNLVTSELMSVMECTLNQFREDFYELYDRIDRQLLGSVAWNDALRKVPPMETQHRDNNEAPPEVWFGCSVPPRPTREQRGRKRHLGDGVYVEFNGALILTTDNGIGSRNGIVLGQEVYRRLVEYAAHLD